MKDSGSQYRVPESNRRVPVAPADFQQMQAFNNILVPVDFSKASDDALRFGLVMGRPYQSDIHLMHDIEIPTETITGATIVREKMDAEYAESERKMEKLERIPEADGSTFHRAILRSTDPKRSILAYAEENDVDLIILGTHGRSNPSEKILGSTAERVLRRSPTPSIALGAGEAPQRIDVILVPVDFSKYSAAAVDHALELARAHEARLILLHAESDDPAGEVEQKLHSLLTERGGDTDGATFITSSDDAAEAIAGAANEHDADLILMVTHGRTGIRRAVTSNVAESVVRRAPCPVMTYRTALEK